MILLGGQAAIPLQIGAGLAVVASAAATDASAEQASARVAWSWASAWPRPAASLTDACGVRRSASACCSRTDQVPVVEHDERVARLHVLVVIDQHAGDEAGDAGRDGRDVAVHLRIVAGDVVPAEDVPAHAPGRRGDRPDSPTISGSGESSSAGGSAGAAAGTSIAISVAIIVSHVLPKRGSLQLIDHAERADRRSHARCRSSAWPGSGRRARRSPSSGRWWSRRCRPRQLWNRSLRLREFLLGEAEAVARDRDLLLRGGQVEHRLACLGLHAVAEIALADLLDLQPRSLLLDARLCRRKPSRIGTLSWSWTA